jgi:hypothetical protein
MHRVGLWLVGPAAGLFGWTVVEYLGHRFLIHDLAGVVHADQADASAGERASVQGVGFEEGVAPSAGSSFDLGTELTFDTLGAAAMAAATEWFRRSTGVDLRPVAAGMVAGSFLWSVRRREFDAEIQEFERNGGSGELSAPARRRRRHLLERAGAVNYGVTTTLWDRVFGTGSA